MFVFDLSKAEGDRSKTEKSFENTIHYLNSTSAFEDLKFDSEIMNPVVENKKNKTEIDIDYLNSKNELEDYIIDTGDTLSIQFTNKPRGLDVVKGDFDTQKTSYLTPRSDLRNYILDTNDVVNIKFTYVPEFNTSQKIDEEGEIYLQELGSIYVRGLTINKLRNLLEKQYDKYLKNTDMEVGIDSFRFINSGNYTVNQEGEIFLPLLDEIYVRGLTSGEISNLISRKYFDSEKIYTEVKIRISNFKPQRILISGEVRNPGVYKFPSYNSASFVEVDNLRNNSSPNIEIENKKNNKKATVNSSESNKFNYVPNNFQIKRPSERINTISNAIKAAGGVTSKSDLTSIEIIRDIPIGKGGGRQKAVIDFNSFLNYSDPTNDIRLFDGDSIFVPKLVSASPDIVPKSVLSGLSPRFIQVNVFGRVETPGSVTLPIEASLSDAIDLTGPIKPLSGKIVLIRYNKDGTYSKKAISYSSRAKRGSKRNPFIKDGDLIAVKDSFIGRSSYIIKEITSPFIGIYSTKEIIEGFQD